MSGHAELLHRSGLGRTIFSHGGVAARQTVGDPTGYQSRSACTFVTTTIREMAACRASCSCHVIGGLRAGHVARLPFGSSTH